VSLRLLIEIAAAALALWVCSWVVMVVLARRLPPGALRDAATFLPACVTTARRLRADPAVPRRAKVALLVAVLWVLSPIDPLPEFLPVIGPLDDVVAVVLLLRYAARAIPRDVLLAAWPAEPRLLLALLGRPERDDAAMPSPRIEAVKDMYRAFAAGDRGTVEARFAEDLVFSTPLDVGLDRAGYFERCWPGAGQGQTFELVRLLEAGDEVVATYEMVRPDGGRGRNTEVFTFGEDDRITRVEVYFGWNVE
jgi:uncharacterized membrane protein YkvA (DUF1232 family)